ncbi:MAG: hypothetical protein KBG20_22055 [Caldilineaceae bacterium]|nr:hypothetical protein [Caldilineaceae bacterium]MBP8107595.1 hypothetical protein [Caldilineaceae bacterium]MBP8125473.1 hypothetical protein [Caldilineaceae bacterium]MBP9075008.1 hypothetical protein [Caldilineaceae bacterium]
MLDYTTDGQPLSADSTLWSRDPLRPLVPYALTPFSASVLTEISKVAWYRYYDRSGYTLPYPPKVIRLYQGRAYLNLSVMGKHDADYAGIEPLTIRVDDRTLPASPYEKPGLLAALKTGRNRRKIDDLLDTLVGEIDTIAAAARLWLDKVEGMKWSQAEILQVMEEIERKGVDSLMAFFAARHNLEIAYNWLLRATETTHPFPSNLILVNNALSDLDGLVEVEVAQDLLKISQVAAKDPVAHAWLEAGDFAQWQKTLPNGPFGDQVRALIKRYGHRGTGEGEMSILRWQEDPAPLLGGMRACLLYQAKSPATVPSSQHVQKLVEAAGGKQGKEVETQLKRARQMLRLQSRALDAYAYILMGTRIWVQGAAKEAMSDGRMTAVDDAFLYELEEIKQMMTGEWNISDRDKIVAVAAKRRLQHEKNLAVRPLELLIGDVEAHPAGQGLSGVIGKVTGPLRRQEKPQPLRCNHAIVGAVRLDSGWAPALPVAGAFVTARGTPVDPIIAAARIWHVPTVLGLGERYDQLADGAQTTVDGSRATVEQ